MSRQGKRIGHMIVGSMSDISVAHRLDQWRPGGGIERYRTPETSDDIDCLDDPFHDQPARMYLAHRHAGATHTAAMAIADTYF